MAHNSTFFLKKISHLEILEAYLSGEFSQLTLDGDKDINIASKPTVIVEEFSTDPHRAIYIDTISKYSSPILYSSNQKAFEVYKIQNKMIDTPCEWCNEGKATTGMVIAHRRECFYNGENECFVKEIFWIYGNHCSFECALGEIEWTRKSCSKSIFNTENALMLTKILFSLSTGKDSEELIAAPYFRLLKSRGGSVEKNDKHKYISNPNIIQIPAKIPFERINI